MQGDLRFARQFGFRHVGHADDVSPYAAVPIGFSYRRKCRAFDADISTFRLQFQIDEVLLLNRLRQQSGKSGANRLCH